MSEHNKTSDLIQSLSQDLKAVRVVRFSKVFWLWLILSLVAGTSVLFLLGLRQDIMTQINLSSFWSMLGLFLGGAIVSVIMTFQFSIPGRELSFGKSIFLFLFFIFFLGAHILFISHLSVDEFYNNLHTGHSCSFGILMLAIIPFIIVNFLIFKLLPMRTFLVALYSSFTALWLGAFFMQMHCPNTNNVHMFLWHYLAILVIGWLISLLLGLVLTKTKK